MAEIVNVGIIGTGKIAPAYLTGTGKFPTVVRVTACADVDAAKARAFAEEHNLRAYDTVDALLADPEIEMVINLTIPAVHAEVSLKILEAGKHVHVEKPLAVTREDGRKVVERARELGLTVTSAPDTFLGGGGQTARKLLDEGAIGQPTSAMAYLYKGGPERGHPNPWFFYQKGGGPLFDMGPYYLTALVNLLGPIKRVSAIANATWEERIAQNEAIKGQKIPVEIPTNYGGVLEFANGTIGTMTMTFDTPGRYEPGLFIYGTEGVLHVPDPNTFTGPVRLKEGREWVDVPLAYTDDLQRGTGTADTAYAIRSGRPNRASGDLAYHVLDAMCAFDESGASGQHITLESTVERPARLPEGLPEGTLDE